jgi:hypothetical protein
VFGREFFELLRTSTFKFERVFVVVFVFKMSSFQMESLKVMEKFTLTSMSLSHHSIIIIH